MDKFSKEDLKLMQDNLQKIYKNSFHFSVTDMINYQSDREKELRKIRKEKEEELLKLILEKKLETEDEIQAYKKKLEDEELAEKLRKELESVKKLSKEAAKEAEKERKKAERELEKQQKKNKGGKGKLEAELMEAEDAFKDVISDNFKEFKEALANPGKEVGKVAGENLTKTLKGVGKAITEGLNQINNSIKKYGEYQTAINTRLQGTSNFSTITKTLGSVAFSPLLKAEDLYSNLDSLVGEGVAYNVEQRAFLMTIKDAVATTFDANAGYMKRIIRIQQEDSTASRLGMESYLTRWLNEYIKNTEYLTTTFDSVADSLFEASALLGSAGNTAMSEEFEYIVQKWLATLTGVGLSESSAQQIAQAIGSLGSGDVSGLGSGAYNLITMAASRTGLNIGDILNTGMDANQVNTLLYGVSSFLSDLGSSSDSNVVKNQLSKVFGVAVSDLVAAQNLKEADLDKVYANVMSRSDMYSELESQMGSITERIGVANILENMFSNLTYQTGMNIAADPVTYAIWKITDLIQGVTGGINIPFISALGTGVDLETTVENLMKIGIVGVSTLGNIGKIASGLNSIDNGKVLLEALNINSDNPALKRGTGASEYVGTGASRKRVSSTTISGSTYIGEEESAAYKEAALTSANEETAALQPDEQKKELENILNDAEYGIQLGERLASIDTNIKDIRSGIGKTSELSGEFVGFLNPLFGA